MKKPELRKLDKMWSLIVREHSLYGQCDVCGGKDVWLNACHIIGRRYRQTRWGAFINGKYDLCGFKACVGCHRQYDEHAPQEDFIRRIVIGVVRYELIRLKSMEIGKIDYETKKKELESIPYSGP